MALSKIGLIDPTAITGETALAATPALTDELLVSDAGTLKRIDFSHLNYVTKVHAITADNDATVVFDSTYLTSTYKRYTLEAYNVQSATDDTGFEMHFSVDNGSNYLSSGITRINFSNTSDASNDEIHSRNTSNQGSIQIGGGVNFGSGTGEVGANTFELVNFSDTGHYKLMYYNGALYNSGGSGGINSGACVINSTAAINNIKLKMTSGVIYGEFVLYGIA